MLSGRRFPDICGTVERLLNDGKVDSEQARWYRGYRCMGSAGPRQPGESGLEPYWYGTPAGIVPFVWLTECVPLPSL